MGNKIKNLMERAFSKERMNSYKDTNEYIDNLKLIQKITPILLNLEIFIRNQVDLKMKEKKGENWIIEQIFQNEKYGVDLSSFFENLEISQEVQKSFKKLGIDITKEKLEIQDTETAIVKRKIICLIISRLSFGFWQFVIQREELLIFKTDLIDFEKYNKLRPEIKKGVKEAFKNNYFKNNAIINVLISIRNRAFHGENLLKKRKKNGKAISVETTYYFHNKKGYKNERSALFGIKPNQLENFLLDCINTSEELKEILNEFNGGGRC